MRGASRAGRPLSKAPRCKELSCELRSLEEAKDLTSHLPSNYTQAQKAKCLTTPGFCTVLEEPDKDGVTLPVINRGCSLHRHWQGERKSRVVIRINFRGHILREPPEAVNSTCSELCPTCWWHRRGSSPYPASARGGRSLPEHTGGRVIARDPSPASLRPLQLPRRPSIIFYLFILKSSPRAGRHPNLEELLEELPEATADGCQHLHRGES